MKARRGGTWFQRWRVPLGFIIAPNGHIYVASVNGVLSVLGAGEKPEVVGQAEFKERLVATPAIVDNKLYVRTADHLWAFGK